MHEDYSLLVHVILDLAPFTSDVLLLVENDHLHPSQVAFGVFLQILLQKLLPIVEVILCSEYQAETVDDFFPVAACVAVQELLSAADPESEQT